MTRASSLRWLGWCLAAAAVSIASLRLLYLTADFPDFSPWFIDQAKFTDEGWWSSAAIAHHLLGHWVVAGDYNPGVALPVFPALLSVVFHFTGVSLRAARAMNVLFSLATLALVGALVRRYGSPRAAVIAMLLLAASPFAYVFSRLAVLDTLVVFECCLMLLVASCSSPGRWWTLAVLALLMPAAVLTKTTAAFLLPAVLWLAWKARGGSVKGRLFALGAVCAATAVLLKAYFALVAARGHAPDVACFFDLNSLDPIAWRESWSTISEILRDGFWIDRILYPLGLGVLVLSLFRLRDLWRNPLFSACWIAIAGQVAFLFRRQNDLPPRYFLVMLVPLIVVVVLALEELRRKRRLLYWPCAAALVVCLVANLLAVSRFMEHRTFQLYAAASAIGTIVRADSQVNPLICSVSGGEISLVTGLPSINDALGTEPLSDKLATYRPGWFVAWNGMDPALDDDFSRFQMQQVASFPAFDDRDRDRLVLYRMVPR